VNPDPPTQQLAQQLAQLRAYHLPEPVSWWPPAPGWWLLGLLILTALGITLWLLLRWRRRGAARRSALRELKTLQAADTDAAALVQALSRLLRRFALARFPREQVAGLTGEKWLQFLDRHAPDQAFTRGPGRALVEAPYRPPAEIPTAELTTLVERWIKANPEAES